MIAARRRILLERRCAARVVEGLGGQRCGPDVAGGNHRAPRIPELREGSVAGDGVDRALPRGSSPPFDARMPVRAATRERPSQGDPKDGLEPGPDAHAAGAAGWDI